MKGDQGAVVDCNVTWTTASGLCNLSSDREDSILVGDESPNGITSLKEKLLVIWTNMSLT